MIPYTLTEFKHHHDERFDYFGADCDFPSGISLRIWATNRPGEDPRPPGGSVRVKVDDWTITIDRPFSPAAAICVERLSKDARLLLDVMLAALEDETAHLTVFPVCTSRRFRGFLVQSWHLPRALCEGPGRTRRFAATPRGIVFRFRRRLVALWFPGWQGKPGPSSHRQASPAIRFPASHRRARSHARSRA